MIIGIHLTGALLALPLGLFVLVRPKGIRIHKRLGRIWVVIMIVVSLSSFGIRGLNGGTFSWIHLLSVLVLFSMVSGVVAIRRKNVERHRAAMRGAYFGLVVAGIFAMLPGRMIGDFLYRYYMMMFT